MKLLLAVLLSAAIFWTVPTDTPVNNSTTARVKARTVQVVAPEKAAEVQSSTPTEQKAEVEPEAVKQSGNEPDATPQTPLPQGCEAYRSLIGQYDWNVQIAYAIMRAENTGCDPAIDNRGLNSDGSVDYGLFQVNSVHAAEVGGNLAALYDPATNIRVAYTIYSGSGWRAWSTYNNGRYLRYL